MNSPKRRLAQLLLGISSLALCLGACATGIGEAATGEVVLDVIPASDTSAEVHFDAATLIIDRVEVLEGESQADVDQGHHDHGHDHGHSHLRASRIYEEEALLGEGTRYEEESRHLGLEESFRVELDLLGGAQRIWSGVLPAAHHEGFVLHGHAPFGCALQATGEAHLEEEEVEIVVCLPSYEVEIPIHFDLDLDERRTLELGFALAVLLEDVDLARASREEDGSISIDPFSNPYLAAQVEQKLFAAFEAAAPRARVATRDRSASPDDRQRGTW